MPENIINHPNHYTSGPFECVELAGLYPFKGGNAIKYAYRWKDKNGIEDLRKALWYLTDSALSDLRPVQADDIRALRMLRTLERFDWQDMHGFWKGMGEIALGYGAGLTRATRALERRVELLESPLSEEERSALSSIWLAEPVSGGLAGAAHRLRARGLVSFDASKGWNPVEGKRPGLSVPEGAEAEGR